MMKHVREGAELVGYAVLFLLLVPGAFLALGYGLAFALPYLPEGPALDPAAMREVGLFIAGGMVAFAFALWAMRR